MEKQNGERREQRGARPCIKSLVAIVPVHERGGMEGDVWQPLVGKRSLVRRKDVPKGRVLLVQNEGEKVVSRVEPVST